jgi:crotonobetainyl-CoA:carnitine CoA-transferase CaiB-like acyl-CoA transferase
MQELGRGPLSGIRVLEVGSSVAGPFCGRLLADFGADVIKIEPPEGDAVRSMSRRVDGRSLYAASIFRNKRLIAVDMRREAGRGLVKQLAAGSDIVVENFRPGTLESWGLGYDVLSALNPGLILVRITGFGQTGPYRGRAGYGIVAEAASGLRHLTGDPDRPPGRINTSLTDEVTGLYAAFGAVMALQARSVTGRGQCVDSALYESAFSLIEPHVPVFGALGIVAQRQGSRLPGSAPNNLYCTKDGRHIHITAMADSVFARLANAMHMPGLATDKRFAKAVDRNDNEDALDDIISGWAARHDLTDLERMLGDASVPASRIYDVADIFQDAHYRARDMLVEIPDAELGTVTLMGITPKLSRTPGSIRHAGGRIGEHTREVLADRCDLSASDIDALAQTGVVVCAPSVEGIQTRAGHA